MLKIIKVLFLICIIFFGASTTFGQGKPVATIKEVNIIASQYIDLPVYCQVRLTERTLVDLRGKDLPTSFIAIRDKWKNKIGKQWVRTHHYCWGIQKYQEAIQMDINDPIRVRKLNSSIKEMDFVLRKIDIRSGEFYALLPSLLQYQANAYTLLGQQELAKYKIKQLKSLKE